MERKFHRRAGAKRRGVSAEGFTPAVDIGAGAGFSGDRTDGAGPVVDALAASPRPAFLMYEMLAERTLADAQLARHADPDAGYSSRLRAFLETSLAKSHEAGIRIVGNFGAANPRGAAAEVLRLASDLGLGRIRVGIVEGDDLLAAGGDARMTVGGDSDNPPAAANAYLGAGTIAEALDAGADVVVTGRVADPSLALGPLVHCLDWAWDDWDRLAAGTLVGHLLECAAQVTGGYFADPGPKDIPDLAHVGFPIAEVSADGDAAITKPPGTGGAVTLATVKEQMLYEIHDPAAYLTPDVILDLTKVHVAEAGPDRVFVSGARGHARPDTLKVTVCRAGGFRGEAGISYGGPGAVARGRLAESIIAERLAPFGGALAFETSLIGLTSLAGAATPADAPEPVEVRLRLAARADHRDVVDAAMAEVEALYLNGPAGGGGVRRHVTPELNTDSMLVERHLVAPRMTLVESLDEL